jgi:hypothetical protein
MPARRPLVFALLLAALAVPSAAGADAGVPGRESDPIVIEGADVPGLVGAQPDRIVAFRYEDGWLQVPVQVDERTLVNYATVRQNHQTAGRPFSHLGYADPNTFAGPDSNPLLDPDDEIAAMAMDVGDRAPIDIVAPDGVAAGSRTEVAIADPLQPGTTRRLYLFRSAGDLDPSAGTSYVDYDFDLVSGDYRSTYSFSGVPGGDSGDPDGPPANPEDSTVETDHYSQHLLSRWVGDALELSAGGATGVDILDGDKAQAFYGCGRSELTFSRGGGGFIANLSGPVRAIRSYIGANSGTYTQRDHVYYQSAEVASTYLRVHAGLAQLHQFLDYSEAADGMTYRNSAQPAGVTIDGVPDPALETGTSLGPLLEWEQATGEQGTVTIMNRLETTLPGVQVGSYYHDDLTPTIAQCGGYADAEAHGASGPAIHNAGRNTDPTLDDAGDVGDPYDLTGTRTIYFSGPGGDAELAEQRAAQVDAPLEVTRAAPRARPLRLRAPGAERVGSDRRARISVRLANLAGAPIQLATLCGEARAKLARVGRCRQARGLAPGATRRLTLKVTLRRAALDKRAVRLRLRADVAGSKPARDDVRLKPRG